MPNRILVLGADGTTADVLERHRPLAANELVRCPGNVEALQEIRTRTYSVLVTDPQTTVREDLALAAEVRHLRPGMRIIVLAQEAAQDDVLAALRSHVFACFSAPFPWGEVAGMVEHAVGADPADDGLEVTSALPHWITVRLSPNRVTGERLVRFMTEYRSDMPSAERDNLMTAFREVLANAIEHGAGFDPEKLVEVSAARTNRAIVYHFRDPGSGFDRLHLPHAAISNPPDQPLAHLEQRAAQGIRPGGFGILIAKQLVDELVYNERGNEVILIKHLD